jgi:hypothetical protein
MGTDGACSLLFCAPDLVRAPRSSAIRKNARCQPRRPPRQPRQRSISAAPSLAGYGARQLKKKIIIFSLRSLVASYSDAGVSSQGLTVTGNISFERQGCYSKTARELVITSELKRQAPFHAYRRSCLRGYSHEVDENLITSSFLPNAPWTIRQR